jgi:hypothetical protein
MEGRICPVQLGGLVVGKQVRFFMSKEDERKFFKVVLEYNSLILDKNAVSLSIEDAQALKDSLFISLPNESINIMKTANAYIDAIAANVIQISKCMVIQNEVLRNGRIWAEFRYYDRNQELITKSKQFSDIYKSFEKWIKNNYQLSKCKDFYIGIDAYKEYKEKKYVLMSGPKYLVEFE